MQIKNAPLRSAAVLLCCLFLSACSLTQKLPQIDYANDELISFAGSRLDVQVQVLDKLSNDRGETPEKVLSAWLYHSDDERLKEDEAFGAISRIAGDSHVRSPTQFANALAQYLIKPDYVCAKPLFYSYFSERYPFQEQQVCNEPVAFELVSNLSETQVTWIDPERIREVHLLFAGNDEKWVSRFGHVSLRLLVCPEGDIRQAACDQNLYEHIVLGYRAHVDELRINSLKGLMGDYRAYLFANPFMEVYREYAIGEFRDVYSLPLTLSLEEKNKLVRVLSEVHWTFSGEYKFLTENCATWLQDLLRITLPSYTDKQLLEERFLRPDSFYEASKESGLVNAVLVSDLSLAEQTGYFFPNTREVYDKAFRLVKEASSSFDFVTLDDYLSTSPRGRMQGMKADSSYWQRMNGDHYLATAQVLLEELATVKADMHLMAALSTYFEKQGLDSLDADLKSSLNPDDYRVFSKCLLGPVRNLIEPIKLANGIPKNGSHLGRIDNHAIPRRHCQFEADGRLLNSVRDIFRQRDEDMWREIERWAYYRADTFTNIYLLKELSN